MMDVEHFVKSMGSHYQRRLVELGESFRGRKMGKAAGLGDWIKAERPVANECYMNAGKYVLMNDGDEPGHSIRTYYEGYWMWSAGIYPVHHAWLVDEDGNVIDLTAEDCDRKARREGLAVPNPFLDQYFGMAVPTWFVREQAFKTKQWGMVSPEFMAHLEKEAA